MWRLRNSSGRLAIAGSSIPQNFAPSMGSRCGSSGYMIREPERAPGIFRLAAMPLTVDAKGACAVDHAPPTAVHVFVSASASRLVPYRPGRLVLLGRLEIGPRVEADGRNSAVRLILDDAAPVRGHRRRSGADTSER